MRERHDGEGREIERERRGGKKDWAEGHLTEALAGKNGKAVGHEERAHEGGRDLSFSLSSDWPE